ncbi:MAG: uracil-DNA glycosylase [Candidatus Binatota bacterium]|nr:uracil-DNA glycosylase [Candidatus Binatota bacterium]
MRALRSWVSDLAEGGLDAVPRARIVTPVAPAPPDARLAAASDTVPSLEDVRVDLGDCRRCRLSAGRRQIVFGTGNANAQVMFVGEGPGEEEDRQGLPFVGRAGQVLTDIITKGMGLERADVYIANVVKCRPPQNRNPEPDEIAACEPFLLRQIESIRPRVIVALGKFAAQTLLQTKTPITKLRGTWHTFRDVKLMPTFHPSYLLRNPADKKLVWQDIQQVMSEIGLPLPPPRDRS